MQTLSQEFENTCCGNLMDDKDKFLNKLRQLELRCAEQQSTIDEYNSLRENKEAFAKKCFLAGVTSNRSSVITHEINQRWLNFRLEIGL